MDARIKSAHDGKGALLAWFERMVITKVVRQTRCDGTHPAEGPR